MPFRMYGETPANFPQLPYLRSLYGLMTPQEQGFCNQVRHMYYIAACIAVRIGPQESGSHVFNGGHVVMKDSGYHYANWAAQLAADELRGGVRWSSHYDRGNCMAQYEVILPKLGCILFGRTAEQHTWFQSESWQATEPGSAGFAKKIAHVVFGYGMHVLSGWKQVGGLGYSEWSEKKGSELVIPSSLVPH